MAATQHHLRSNRREQEDLLGASQAAALDAGRERGNGTAGGATDGAGSKSKSSTAGAAVNGDGAEVALVYFSLPTRLLLASPQALAGAVAVAALFAYAVPQPLTAQQQTAHASEYAANERISIVAANAANAAVGAAASVAEGDQQNRWRFSLPDAALGSFSSSFSSSSLSSSSSSSSPPLPPPLLYSR